MLENIREILVENCHLDPVRPILVGVSGGADSLCLMDIMARSGFKIIVAHMNHGLRQETETEAQTVQHYADELGVGFLSGSADVLKLASSERLTIEQAARKARYEFLFSQAMQLDAQAVAVGHTADDQVETVLMNMLRGAGLAGLKGMAYRTLPTEWSESIPLVRPLLGVWRDQVMEYIQVNAYQAVIDASNLDTRFTRNRIRHELIPYLEEYNPGIRQVLWRTATILQEDFRFLSDAVEHAWRDCLLDEGSRYISLDYARMNTWQTAIVRQVLRKALSGLTGQESELDFSSVDRALRFMRAPSAGKQVNLYAGIRVFLEGERLWLTAYDAELPKDEWPQLLDDSAYPLELPGEQLLANGWVLRCEVESLSQDRTSQIFQNSDTYQIWVDPQAYRPPFVLGARVPGDRIIPMGMSGHSMKLSDFMINSKIPERARARWPIVYGKIINTDKKEIVWVAGYRQSERSQISERTTQVIHMSLCKE